MSAVIAPRAKCALRPEQGQHGKECAHEFMEQLLQRKPEAAKTTLWWRLRKDRPGGGRHKDILAQVAELYESAVNRLETTKAEPLVSNRTES